MTDSGSMTNPSEALEPCPFCESQAGRAHDITMEWVYCAYGCGAEGGKVPRGRPNASEEAARLWNTRSQQAATPAAPVQDDDAEWLRDYVGARFLPGDSRDRLDRIAARLTPDRVTPCQECENLKHDLERAMKRENELLNRLTTALRDGGFDA